MRRSPARWLLASALLVAGAYACSLDESGVAPPYDASSGTDAAAEGRTNLAPGDDSGAGGDASTCPAGHATCGDAGACATDLATDPASCGACGHDCLGGACVAGACQPVVLASAGTAFDLALADGGAGVYFTALDAGALLFVPLDGGAPRVMVSGVAAPRGLSLDDDHVYYAASAADYVARVPRGPAVDAGEEQLTTQLCATPIQTQRFGNQVFWSNNDSASNAIVHTNADGSGSPAKVAGDAVNTRGIVVNAADGYVYWVNATDRTVARVKTSGGAVEHLFTLPAGGPVPLELVVDRGEIWVAAETPPPQPADGGAGALYRLAVPTDPADAGPLPAPVAVTSGTRDVAVDSSFAYFTNFYDGTVARVARDAGASTAPEVLARGQASPVIVRVDDRAVYWTNDSSVNGALMRLAKP